jgi:Carboxypeptidase regulatory-like domain
MKWRVFIIFTFALMLGLCGSKTSKAQEQPVALPDAPRPQPGIIVGTVVDVNGSAVPGATVVLAGTNMKSPRTVVTNSNGFFEFNEVEPGAPYHVNIGAQGFASWTSPDVTLTPGQYVILPVNKLRVAKEVTTVTVGYSPEEVATEQVKIEEKQRVFGIIPNFYVSYEKDAAPLTTKLKFQLAAKVTFDPITFLGVAIVAAAGQAGDHPNYQEGWKGYGERYGAAYANGFTDIMIGGAILPSLLHQDPRYFYQGTGTNKSRAFHALASPFVCRGDNGQPQPNYSTIGGDLASAALSNADYPASNRGVGLFLSNFLIGTGQRAASNLMQEFVLRRLTPKARNQNNDSN